MKKTIIGILIILSIPISKTFAYTVTPRYPKNKSIIEFPCGGYTFVDLYWDTDYPEDKMVAATKHYTPDGKELQDMWGTHPPKTTFVNIEGEHTWKVGHLTRDIFEAQKLTPEGIQWNFTETMHFTAVCIPDEEDEEVINEPPVEEEIKEEQIKPKEEVTKIENIKKTTKEVSDMLKNTYKEIKESFRWDVKITEAILSSLESIFYIQQEQDLAEGEENENKNEKEESKIKKPLSLPFEKIIGVTQWYGNTIFQQSHKGIDFGASEEIIIAPANGKVVGAGYDKYNSNWKCFSGGKYLIIEHSNGLHTAYFHLKEYFVKANQSISKGEKIALSGNSGKWNCQNLKSHLHFETRKERSQSTHVNPVDYIETDWSKVPTLGYEQIPGRLSGQNPHPTY